MAARKSKAKPVTREARSSSSRSANSARAAKKTAKKVVKKATKKAAKKQVPKKVATKVAKKAVKKAAKKAPTKKAVKQVAPKKVTKKAPAKKAPAKKAVKQAPPEKVARKTAPAKPEKPAKKVEKKAPAPKQVTQPEVKVVKSSHSAAFIKKQRQRLLDLRDELLDTMSGMTRDTIRNAPEGSEASGSGQHQGDAGSDAYDRDFALSVLAKEQDALYEIQQALYRIDHGTYGVCEISLEKIPQMRLEAIPFARLTVACQAQWEQEYGNRRFRPSNEVGFSGGNQFDDEDSASVSLDDDD